MHPLFQQTRHLAAYVGAWLLFGGLMTVTLAGPQFELWPRVALFLLPISVVYGFICLAAWYPCRANPLGEVGAVRLGTLHLAGSLLSAGLWHLVALLWGAVLARLGGDGSGAALYREQLPVFLAAGVLLYLLSATGHYLLLAWTASRRAASAALELELLAREAELEAFKAQIDPHFLFNCLNSISSLCGSDPEAARRTTIRLGEFLRTSLALGSRDLIPLRRELELVGAYLDVERARFGDRLRYEPAVEAACLDHPVPALLLQPLLENALKHGVAHRLEGTTVRLEARPIGGRLRLTVTNECEPQRPRGTGTGIGLANVRGRLDLLYRDEAVLSVRDLGARHQVTIDLPRRAAARGAA